jgi:hypothetical protein
VAARVILLPETRADLRGIVEGRRRVLGIRKEGTETIGQRIGLAGESLRGEELAARVGPAIGRKTSATCSSSRRS